MPQLVIAPGSFKVFPGGVVAVRAADFIDGVSSATSEADALASTGECVRETQQVAAVSPPDLDSDSYGDAADTLSIPVDNVGLEVNLDYFVYVTYRLEGGFDDGTDGDLLNLCSQHQWESVAAIGMHGTTTEPESSPSFEERLLGNQVHYAITRLFLSDVDAGDVLKLRAYVQTGLSVEVLIDQLIFIPDRAAPFQREVFGEQANGTATALVDGADAGDDNGKFTFFDPQGGNNLDTFFGGNPVGSADYQRYADPDDGEWNVQVSEADTLFSLHDGSNNPISAAGYSLHAARFKPFSTTDTFDNRTTAEGLDMGVNEDGYGWRIGGAIGATPPRAYVTGGVAILRLRQSGGNVVAEFGDVTQTQNAVDNQGARFEFNDGVIFSGELEWTAGAVNGPEWRIAIQATGNLFWYIRIFPLTGLWGLYKQSTGGTFTQIGTSNDISSWFGLGAPLGFKIEVKRYVLRARVWDASGAEPSTWDEEVFKDVLLSGTEFVYPYSDVIARAQAGYEWLDGFAIEIRDGSPAGDTFPYDVTIHEATVEHDPYGSADDITVRIESPEGSLVGEQVVPFGCPHFVYWGARRWTETGGGTERVSFSSKLVNDPAAAELQRAEGTFYIFMPGAAGIVSMNWSSEEAIDVDRIHATV